MVFGNRSVKKRISLNINNKEINRVEAKTVLGILIDAKLTWKNHISLLKSKLSTCCAVMHRVNFAIDKRGMLILYNSLFLPHSMYCIEIWGNTYATNANYLVLLQKRLFGYCVVLQGIS